MESFLHRIDSDPAIQQWIIILITKCTHEVSHFNKKIQILI